MPANAKDPEIFTLEWRTIAEVLASTVVKAHALADTKLAAYIQSVPQDLSSVVGHNWRKDQVYRGLLSLCTELAGPEGVDLNLAKRIVSLQEGSKDE